MPASHSHAPGRAPALRLDYQPAGETLRAFRASKAAVRGLTGPIQGGRKTCAVHDILIRAAKAEQQRWRWVAVRADSSALEEQTIAAWHRWVPASIGQWDPRALRHRIGFDIGGRERDLDIVFLALDRIEHRRRLQSIETSGFWLDGADSLDRTVFDKALELAGGWPLDEAAEAPVICTSRVPAADHWLFWRPELTLFRQPGGRTARPENLEHLTPGYYRRLARTRSPEWVAQYVDAKAPVSPELAALGATAKERIALKMARLEQDTVEELAA